MKKTLLASALMLAFAGVANASVDTIELDWITATGNWNGGHSHNDEYFAFDMTKNLSVINTSGIALNNIDKDDGTKETININNAAKDRKAYFKGTIGIWVGGTDNLIRAQEIEIVGTESNGIYLAGELTLDAQVVTIKSLTGSNTIQGDAPETGSRKDVLTVNAKKLYVEANGPTRSAVRAGGDAEFIFNAEEITLKGQGEGGNAINLSEGNQGHASITLNANKTILDGNVIVGDVTKEGQKSSMSATGVVELHGETNNIANLKDIDGKDSAKLAIQNENVTLIIDNNQAANLELTAGEGMSLDALADAVTINNGAEGVKLSSGEGDYSGASTGLLGANGKLDIDTIKTQVNSIMSNTLDLASATPLAMNRLLMNDVRKRMGDLRSSEGTHGVWARYDGGKLSGANGLDNDFTTVQVGIDTVPVADAPRFGVAFAYTTSDADMKRGGAEMDAYSLAFYGTKMYDNGMFVDVIGRMATADTDVTVDGNKKGSMDNVALSLSGELGWRFDVTEKFYFEPQAELTYTYVNADTLTLAKGGTYDFDSVDSLMGRVGFAAGFKCPNNFGDVYVRASAIHEFLGDAAVTGGNGTIHEVDGEDTWVEFGIGGQFNINKNTYVYADIERTEGAKLEEDWRANVGVRFAF